MSIITFKNTYILGLHGGGTLRNTPHILFHLILIFKLSEKGSIIISLLQTENLQHTQVTQPLSGGSRSGI